MTRIRRPLNLSSIACHKLIELLFSFFQAFRICSLDQALSPTRRACMKPRSARSKKPLSTTLSELTLELGQLLMLELELVPKLEQELEQELELELELERAQVCRLLSAHRPACRSVTHRLVYHRSPAMTVRLRAE